MYDVNRLAGLFPPGLVEKPKLGSGFTCVKQAHDGVSQSLYSSLPLLYESCMLILLGWLVSIFLSIVNCRDFRFS